MGVSTAGITQESTWHDVATAGSWQSPNHYLARSCEPKGGREAGKLEGGRPGDGAVVQHRGRALARACW